jgi:hypothetical protein
MFDALKAAMAEFRRGYTEARAKAQPAPLIESPEFRNWITTTIQDAYNEGVQHERERIAASWAAERATVDRPTEPSPLETRGRSPSSLLH